MLGEPSDQRGLWEADRLHLDHVGQDTFYGLLTSLRGRLFRNADCAGFYFADNGRDNVPPSLLATASCCRPTTRSATPRPRPGLTSTSAGRWLWGLRQRICPLLRAHCRCSGPMGGPCSTTVNHIVKNPKSPEVGTVGAKSSNSLVPWRKHGSK